MKIFNRKPQSVQAVQFIGKNEKEILDILYRCAFIRFVCPMGMSGGNAISAEAYHRSYTIRKGDWVVLDEKGRLFTYRDETFKELFEEA